MDNLDSCLKLINFAVDLEESVLTKNEKNENE